MFVISSTPRSMGDAALDEAIAVRVLSPRCGGDVLRARDRRGQRPGRRR